MANNDVIVLFPNTTAELRYSSYDNSFLGWRITADEGYVLHEITHDEEVFDEMGNPTGEVRLGYTRATIFVGYNYNFETNPRQIYAVLESKEE